MNPSARRAVLLLFLGFAFVAPASGEDIPTAMRGYDPVAYFAIAAPTKGSVEFFHVWDGGRYLFSSAENRDRFKKEPARYAPQFPGFCAASLARGHAVSPDPQHWIIVDGRLYLFAGARGPDLLRENPRLVEKAEEHWKGLRKN